MQDTTVPAAERAEIVDALYRFGAGQDLRDRALFESAFAAEATLDFTGPARRLGATLPVFQGREAISDTVFSTIADLDTTHTVTNRGSRRTTANARPCSRSSRRSICRNATIAATCC